MKNGVQTDFLLASVFALAILAILALSARAATAGVSPRDVISSANASEVQCLE
jgi:hypothetical protein